MAVVFPQAGFDRSVLIFRARPGEERLGGPAEEGEVATPVAGIRRVKLGDERSLFVAERDGWVVAGRTRQPVRIALRRAGQSLRSRMSGAEVAMCRDADVFVYFSIESWRPRLLQGMALVKLVMAGAQAASANDAMQQANVAMADWLVAGLTSMLAELEATSASVRFEEEGFRLSHYHAFSADGKTAAYLKQVKRCGGDVWAGLGSRPFMLAAAIDWECPAEHSLTAGMMTKMFSVPAVQKMMSDQERESMFGWCAALYGGTTGGAWVIDIPESGAMRMHGTYRLKDPAQASATLRTMAEKAPKFAGLFLSAMQSSGGTTLVNRGGHEVYELKLDFSKIESQEREVLEALYGTRSVMQMAMLGEGTMSYCMTPDTESIVEMARDLERGAATLERDERVGRLCAKLPRDFNLIGLMDLRRVTAVAPRMMGLRGRPEPPVAVASARGSGVPEAPTPPVPPVPTPPPSPVGPGPGPLLGCTVTIDGPVVRGEWYISSEDTAEAVGLLKSLAHRIKAEAHVTAGSRSGVRIEVRQQRKEPTDPGGGDGTSDE